MKKLLLLSVFLAFFVVPSNAQSDSSWTDTTAFYMITYNEGEHIIAQILKSDDREVFVRTKDGRKFYIPQYVIKELERLESIQTNADGTVISDDPFATRYFMTTNGIPLKKGTSYMLLGLSAVDFQFSVSDKVGIGFMSTWLGVPLIGNIKVTVINEETHQLAMGMLVGTASWAKPDLLAVLPFGTLSFGNRTSNFSASAGYGKVWSDGYEAGRALIGFGGMGKVSEKVSFVFDSFILLPYETTVNHGFLQETTIRHRAFGFLIPGFRWHKSRTSAFQLGFAGLIFGGELVAAPLPMVRWFRRL